jgi:uroporphyrinogen III methyltransferase/synthase
MNDRSAQVFLVGAGPGHPGLLTLRAVECLARADLVLYDKLVPEPLLKHAPSTAERVCVTDLPGSHPERWPHVHARMIAAAQKGKCVVRLKGGDPCLFGRGGEEAQALHEAGIRYEIVPGVTAGLAAAFAGIPLTHRFHASAVAFVTGHEDPTKPDSHVDWSVLARFSGTLVIYMAIARLPEIVQALLRHGKEPSMPTVAIQNVGTGMQRTVEAPLAHLADAVRQADLHAPAIVIIGEVVALRRQLAWFERRPLFGKRVLVARPEARAEPLIRRLEELGATVHPLPALEIREPADWGPVDVALRRLSEYQWLVFTSVNGVHAFIRRLTSLGMDLRAVGGLKFAAIGSMTADALRNYHLRADVVPARFRSEELADALKGCVAGRRVLLARADRGRDVLREELARVCTVDQIAVYSQVDAVSGGGGAELVQNGKLDYVTLTSSNIARAWIGALDEQARERIDAGSTQIVSISPLTSSTIRELGLPVAAEAAEYTSEGVVEALVELAAREPR